MEQAINLGFLKLAPKQRTRTLEQACRLAADAGFKCLDYLSPCKELDFEEQAKRELDVISRFGLKVVQAHCPFFRYQQNGVDNFKRIAPQAVKAAKILNATCLVIHADEIRGTEDFQPDKILRQTVELLKPVVELCAEYGIRPAIENLFEDGLQPKFDGRSRFTAKTPEIIGVINAFPGTGIGCCWDAGHLHVAYPQTYLDELRTLAPYIICTHIHDNNGDHDYHKPAFMGSIDWTEVMKILKDVDYDGPFSWEFVYERIPDPLLPDYLKLIHKTGDYLMSL